jgi:choice-of-anchor C domain-containing protein
MPRQNAAALSAQAGQSKATMRNRKTTAVTIITVLIGCTASVVEAQDLINGSFEVGLDPNVGSGQNLGMTAPDSITVTGWTVSSGTVDYIGDRWVAGEGARCIDLSGTSAGSISQTIGGFTPGLTYEVRFLMAANPEGGSPTKSLQVGIGNTAEVFSFTGQGTAADLGWTQRTLDFTATASTLTLSFTSLEDNASGAALDAVSVVAVPEPGAWSLCATGLGLFTVARVWRRLRG